MCIIDDQRCFNQNTFVYADTSLAMRCWQRNVQGSWLPHFPWSSSDDHGSVCIGQHWNVERHEQFVWKSVIGGYASMD